MKANIYNDQFSFVRHTYFTSRLFNFFAGIMLKFFLGSLLFGFCLLTSSIELNTSSKSSLKLLSNQTNLSQISIEEKSRRNILHNNLKILIIGGIISVSAMIVIVSISIIRKYRSNKQTECLELSEQITPLNTNKHRTKSK